MKTLIINGSPRPQGNTAALIAELRRHLPGEVAEISAFRANIAPCVDCRGCWQTAQCVVEDDMQTLYADDFDCLVLASPVYFGTLPGQVLNLMRRLQPWHAATYFLKQPLQLRPKKAGVILTGGGKNNLDLARHHIRAMCRMLGADWEGALWATSTQTDAVPAWEDAQALDAVRQMARRLAEHHD